MKIGNFRVLLLIIFAILILHPKISYAQSCSGAITCISINPDICCPSQGAGCSQPRCLNDYSIGCSGSNQAMCTDEEAQCGSGKQVIGTCTWTGSAPPPDPCPAPGEYWCSAYGTCAAGCKNTGGLTCTDWLIANCVPAGDPPPPPPVDPPPPPSSPTCSISISPASLTLDVADSAFTVTTNVNSQNNGTISRIDYSLSNSLASISPSSDSSSPFTTSVNPIAKGSVVLTARAVMGGSTRCTATRTINITDNPAPMCDSFTLSSTSITQGETVNINANLSDAAENILPDGGFETGSMTYWPTRVELGSWDPIDAIANVSIGSEGSYYARITRASGASDPHAATDWINTGSNVQGKVFTLEFLAKSHEYGILNPLGLSNIPRILIQSRTWGGAYLPVDPTIVNYEWRKFKHDLTINNGSPTNDIRVVLRPPENFPNEYNPSTGPNLWPIYYDSVKLYRTSDSGINASTIRFYYAPSTSNLCTGSSWTQMTGTLSNLGNDQFSFSWDTTSVPTGSYTITVNAEDNQGNLMSGNPGSCSDPNITYDNTCSATVNIQNCTPTCAASTACGTLNNAPSAVSNITVNGITGNNLNLSTNPLPITISWTPATITSPSVISDHDVWLVPRGATIPASQAECINSPTCRVVPATGANSVSLSEVFHEQTNYFDILVRAKNGCARNGVWTRRRVNLLANVTGSFIDSSNGPDSSNNCNGGGSSTTDISAAYNGITHTAGGGTITFSNTNYSITNIPYAPTSSWGTPFDITLNLNNAGPDSIYCNCPGSGSNTSCTQTDTFSPSTNDFYVSSINLSNSPWWQASQGNIYGYNNFSNPIPDACGTSPTCNANIVLRNSDEDEKSAGIPLSGGFITSGGYYTDFDNSGNQPHANQTPHDNLIKEDYNYFIRTVDVGSLQTISGTINDFNGIQTGTTYNGAELYYSSGDVTFDLTTPGTVSSTDKKIFFVDGNIIFQGTPDTKVLDVQDGGYVAFIASGTITFDESIGNVMTYPSGGSTATNIDGVFIADNITIADDADDTTKDNLFVGDGTFVGWNGVTIQRSYNNTSDSLDAGLNNEYPTAIFNFRPDFTVSTPDIIRKPYVIWQEVN